jgi:hypothetical protein
MNVLVILGRGSRLACDRVRLASALRFSTPMLFGVSLNPLSHNTRRVSKVARTEGLGSSVTGSRIDLELG